MAVLKPENPFNVSVINELLRTKCNLSFFMKKQHLHVENMEEKLDFIIKM